STRATARARSAAPKRSKPAWSASTKAWSRPHKHRSAASSTPAWAAKAAATALTTTRSGSTSRRGSVERGSPSCRWRSSAPGTLFAMSDAPRQHGLRDPAKPLHGAHVVVGVGGGIAAYKAAELVRLLDKAGATTDVAMTGRAQKFVGPMTFQALTRRPVFTDLFSLTEEATIG